jgi:dienelactone hydrolase
VKQWQWLIIAATFFIWGNAANAQERIQFRSLESSATVLDGYLYPSIGAGRHPAVVFLHGCSGMFDRSTGLISRLERDWASVLNGDGYLVLMVAVIGSR